MTSTTSPRIRAVGVDLQDTGEESSQLVDSIVADNAGAEVTRLPGLVRVQAPAVMTIRRETVERHLGRGWETHEFQMAIVSYFGHIAEWDDDEIVIKWDH
ncbi:phenol hydroxylase P2 protein [Streptomyces sp. BK022]|uniref:MmoB/DmpM family protein n=1 Tax=Streptomyces sp. BK022 TaxID=2512123 RepID=UPI00102911AC|nr:MmoB/DmpM family protein [Streptomyces sp. BK022]RZU37829.1 phenol hydroxylase P2 protein [Streptomyces sp. BK022]